MITGTPGDSVITEKLEKVVTLSDRSGGNFDEGLQYLVFILRNKAFDLSVMADKSWNQTALAEIIVVLATVAKEVAFGITSAGLVDSKKIMTAISRTTGSFSTYQWMV